MTLSTAFILGAFAGALVSWIAWDWWAFGWTAKHQLRADLFTLARDEVFEELAFVTRERSGEYTPEPRARTMPNAPELFRIINSTPLLQSLLYDLNLLPECITDPVRWAYMVAVCEHMTAALARGAAPCDGARQ